MSIPALQPQRSLCCLCRRAWFAVNASTCVFCVFTLPFASDAASCWTVAVHTPLGFEIAAGEVPKLRAAATVNALHSKRISKKPRAWMYNKPSQPAVAVDALLHGRTDILLLWFWGSRQMQTLRVFLFEQSTDADGREFSNLLLSYSKKKCHPANEGGRSRHGSS